MAIGTPPPDGVHTHCNTCGRPLREGDAWGDDCECGGQLSMSEDRLTMYIRSLQQLAARRLAEGGQADPEGALRRLGLL